MNMTLRSFLVPNRLAYAALVLVTSTMACSPKTTPSASPDCNALAACCATSAFPAGSVSTCTNTVSANDDAACQGNLSVYSSLGFCSGHGGSSSGSSGAGGSVSSGAGGAGGATSTSSSSGAGGATSTSSSSGTAGGGPIIQSFSANPTVVTPTSGTMISAIVSDTSGVADLTGGTLLDQPSGTNYGAFLTPGGQGTFVYALTWQQIYQAQAFTFAPGGSVQRVVTGKFFDQQARSTEQSLTLTLECGDATSSPCSTACANLTDDLDNCGACGMACSATPVYTFGGSCECLAGHCTSTVATTNENGHVSGASCDAACQSIGAKCVANVCPNLPMGAENSDNMWSSCSSSDPGACCCQQ